MTLTVLNLHQKRDPVVQQNLKVKVTTTRSKVKSRSHHDAAHLQPLTNVPTKHQLPTPHVAHLYPLTNVATKYQLPTPYGFRDIARTRFYRSRSLRQGQRSNQGQTMTLHTYTPYPIALPSINFLHLMVSKI